MIKDQKNGLIQSCLCWVMYVLVVAQCGTNGNEDIEESQEVEESKSADIDLEKSDRPLIELSLVKENEFSMIRLDYISSEESGTKPRLAEIYVHYSENLEYKKYQQGTSVENADKQLIVQEHSEGRLRLVVLAQANINELDTGSLATLTFSKKDTKESVVRLLTDRPIFAPEEANEGLLVGEPLTF